MYIRTSVFVSFKTYPISNIGDNILVRDHTSKAFQPKYKDFYIVGLLGKTR